MVFNRNINYIYYLRYKTLIFLSVYKLYLFVVFNKYDNYYSV